MFSRSKGCRAQNTHIGCLGARKRVPSTKTPDVVFPSLACVKGCTFDIARRVLAVLKEKNSAWKGGPLPRQQKSPARWWGEGNLEGGRHLRHQHFCCNY